MNHKIRMGAAISILFVAGSICAQNKATEKVEPAKNESIARDSVNIDSLIEDALNLDAVVVTGTRTPKMLKDTPIVTRLITTSEIKRSDATNIADLLTSELPGIEFGYSMNQQTSLNMGGFGGNSVLFLVDGERLAGETLNNIDYDRLNLDNVKSVEIVKGAASSLYGSNAVGGVVNIISETAKKPWHVNVNGRWGAYGAQRYGLTASFNQGHFNSVTNVQYNRVGEIDLHTDVSEGGAYNKVYAHHSWSIKERLIYRVTDRLSLTGRASYFFRERDYSAESKDRYRDFAGGIRGNYNFENGGTLEATYSYDQYDKSDFLTMTRYDVRDYSNVQHNVTANYSQRFADRVTMTVGGDFMRDYLMSYQFEDGGSKKQYTWDLYAQADWDITKKFNILAGLRYDHFTESSSSRLTEKVSLMYKLRPYTFRLSYAGGFRAPTLKEMYMNFDMASIFMIYGNPNLKPETSHNFQATAEYSRGYYSVTLTGFYNHVKNRITTAWSDELNGQMYVNLDPVNITGLEFNASARWPFGLGAKLSYAYTHESLKPDQQYSVTRPHTATVRLNYGKEFKNYEFDLALNGRILGSVDEIAYDTGEVTHYPTYTMWKLNMSNRVWRGINVNLIVDNLFNYRPRYYYANSPTTRGTTFAVSVGLNIDELLNK